MANGTGIITQVVGPVVDVHFSVEDGELPRIHEALEIKRENGRTLVVEVQQHIGEDTVRCVAMDSTDGLSRGMAAAPTGQPIAMPVGAQIRGRVMNVVGETIDGLDTLSRSEALPIHREPPKFEDLTTSQEVLFTGIKVIDLLEPYLKGGKIGLFGGAGVGERSREGNDLWNEMKESGVIDKTALVFGQMNETAGARLRVPLAGLTI
ncbi:MAG: F0F1 ATP synthase subunit beta, partial [Bacteroidales bacterium]|nr:F0F1 ATP synthase subunit beta [Bacteroidales bacterium]